MKNWREFNSAVCACGLTCVGLAGSASVNADTTTETVGLDTVIVTATRTEQSLQKVPAAVTVFSGKQISELGIVDIGDLGLRIPGFYTSRPTRQQTNFALRGAGSAVRNPGLDQPTALFVDDVYVVGGSATEFDLLDIERIEVLRGPQGTLYGKNVVGGAVNVVTRKPTAEPYALAEVTAGNYGRLDAGGLVSGRLGDDKLTGQLAFSHRGSDGYTTNLTTGNKLEQEDVTSARGRLRYKPSNAVDIIASMQYSRDKSTGIERILRGDPLSYVVPLPDDHTSVQNVDGRYDRELQAFTLDATFNTDWGAIKSVTGYRKSDNKMYDGDNDGTPLTLVHFLYQLDDIKQFSQELRLTGSSGKLDWVAGLYYLNIDFAQNDAVQIAGAPGSLASIVLTGRLGKNGATEIFGQKIETDSYAMFGQLGYLLTPELKLSVGGRYTDEKKTGNTYCASIGQQCLQIYDIKVDGKWSAFTPRVGLEYTPVEGKLIYATVSKGFKSGGFMTGYPTAVGADSPFKPEYALSYELGLKSRWLKNLLQVNVAGFSTEYTDLQVRQISGTGSLMAGNAGEAKAKGVELEVVVNPAKGLNLYATYGYLDATYKKFILQGQNYSGNTMMLSPKDSLSMGGSYDWKIANGGSVKLSADYQYKSKVYFGPENDNNTADKLDGILNASVTYATPDKGWEISLWGRNLGDKHNMVQGSNFSFFSRPVADFQTKAKNTMGTRLIPPLTFGVTVRWNM